jgi:pheromone shutdown protein TraB
MKKETATIEKAMPITQNSDGKPTKFDQEMYQRNLFLVLLLNMTWQLAIVVLIPVVGGFELDQHYHATPLWIIIGGVVALLGVIAVLRNILIVASGRAGYNTTVGGGKK